MIDYEKIGQSIMTQTFLACAVIILLVYVLFRQQINRFVRRSTMNITHRVKKAVVPMYRVVVGI